MTVSAVVRAYYTKNIFLQSGRDKVPKNYRPLEVPATGKATVEGCAGGGKNILELFLLGGPGPAGEVIRDLRASCGLCNPAMYAAADVVCEWARGRTRCPPTSIGSFENSPVSRSARIRSTWPG